MQAQQGVRGNFRAKGKYLLPNSITALSMILGLISVYYAYHGQFVVAGWVILYSTVLDKLDGSAARVLNASSDFGVQMDSFSDLIAFGIAPAFLVFSICVSDPDVKNYFLEKDTPFFLYFSILFFVLACTLRLARFNVTTLPGDRLMIGLATTGSGGFISSYILTCYVYKDIPIFVTLLQGLPYLLLFLAALMVSNLPMTKVGKKKTAFGRGLEVAVLITVLVCIITRSVPAFIFMTGFVYTAIGFYQGFRQRAEIRATEGDATDATLSESAADEE